MVSEEVASQDLSMERFYVSHLSSYVFKSSEECASWEGRGGGKSYWASSCIQAALLTDGVEIMTII